MVILVNICVYTYMQITIKKDTMNLKESIEGCMVGIGEGKGR